MKEVLLCSDEFVKGISNIDENLNGKIILPAIREAQNTQLRGILGDRLVEKLCQLVLEEKIDKPENADYKVLLDKCKYFLAYSAISDIIILTSVKISPAGNEQISDERMDPINLRDSFELQSYYQHKADHFCKLLQNFLLQNKSKYPELSQNQCHSIKSNLWNAATTGLWLGGVRGKGHSYRLRDKYNN